jgi:hypothetical protein
VRTGGAYLEHLELLHPQVSTYSGFFLLYFNTYAVRHHLTIGAPDLDSLNWFLVAESGSIPDSDPDADTGYVFLWKKIRQKKTHFEKGTQAP